MKMEGGDRARLLLRGLASAMQSERAGGTRAEDRLLLHYSREIHSEQSSIEVAAKQQKKRGMK